MHLGALMSITYPEKSPPHATMSEYHQKPSGAVQNAAPPMLIGPFQLAVFSPSSLLFRICTGLTYFCYSAALFCLIAGLWLCRKQHCRSWAPSFGIQTPDDALTSLSFRVSEYINRGHEQIRSIILLTSIIGKSFD